MTMPTPAPNPTADDAAMAAAAAELSLLARQALADSPAYVENIASALTRCTEDLRAGDDRAGLAHFARGASDLEQLLLLFEHIASIARPNDDGPAAEFRRDVHACVHALEQRLVGEDITGLCDTIEGTLLPVLPRWTQVVEELDRGFRARGI